LCLFFFKHIIALNPVCPMSRKILIVNDEASVGESLSEKPSQQRFDCETAAGGEEALEWTEHDSSEVIISD